MDLLQALTIGTRRPDETEGRVYGFLYGRITDVSDPKKLGRVRARIGSQAATDSTDWLCPLWPGAIEGVPYVKQPVVVGFLDGNVHAGFYAVIAETTSGNRATDAQLLGTTFVGLYNDLVTKFNNLKTQFNAHTHQFTATATFTPLAAGSGGVAPAGTSMSPTAPDSDANAPRGKAPDGSYPGPTASDSIVLSANARLR